MSQVARNGCTVTRNQRLVLIADCVLLGVGLFAAGLVLENVLLEIAGPLLLIIAGVYWRAGSRQR